MDQGLGTGNYVLESNHENKRVSGEYGSTSHPTDLIVGIFCVVTSIHSVKLRFAYIRRLRKNKHILQMVVKNADESHGRILKNY